MPFLFQKTRQKHGHVFFFFKEIPQRKWETGCLLDYQDIILFACATFTSKARASLIRSLLLSHHRTLELII